MMPRMLSRFSGRRQSLDQRIEGALGVQHHHRERAGHVETSLSEHLSVDELGLGLTRQTGLKPTGGIDGEAEHPFALPGRGQPQRRTGGGLSHTTAAHTQQDPTRAEEAIQVGLGGHVGWS